VWDARQKRENGESDEGPKDPDNDPQTKPDSSPQKKTKNGGGRQPLSPHLQRERIVHDLPDAEKHCAVCAQVLRPIGEESSERYEYIPAQLMVVEDVCKKYACECTVRRATKPAQPIEKSIAGASLLAEVIVAKRSTMYRCTGKRKSSSVMGWRSRVRRWAVGWDKSAAS
jgi:transposase